MQTKHRWRKEDDWENRSAQIVAMRLDKMTHQEIGDHFGISRERVRQVINRHMRLLRNEEPHMTARARRAIRLLLTEHHPIEILRIKGVGLDTLHEIERFMEAGGYKIGEGRWLGFR